MKPTLLIAALLAFSTNVFAAEKICFGLKSDDTTKGSHFKVKISKSKLEVLDGDNKGSYKRYKGKAGTVEGKDGVTYMDYDMGGDEGCTEILVAEDLADADGKGEMKFRCRGEGFGDNKYFCRDPKDSE